MVTGGDVEATDGSSVEFPESADSISPLGEDLTEDGARYKPDQTGRAYRLRRGNTISRLWKSTECSEARQTADRLQRSLTDRFLQRSASYPATSALSPAVLPPSKLPGRVSSLRGDLDRRFRLAGLRMRGSVTSLFDKFARGRSTENEPSTRKVKIDLIGNRMKIRLNYEHAFDTPHKNYSTALRMVTLMDGKFKAELPLHDVPDGDLSLCIHSHRVVLVVTARGRNVDKNHKITQSYSCGYLELPIYVDPFTLTLVPHEEEEEFLKLECHMKGYVDRRFSEATPPKPKKQLRKTLSTPIIRMSAILRRSSSFILKRPSVDNIPEMRTNVTCDGGIST